MALDACRYDFAQLASSVLPAYMRIIRRAIDSAIPMSDFAQDGHGPVTLARRFGFERDIEGCYVLIDGEHPIYVGISRHVFERLRQHVRPGDHYTATLAYQMAKTHHPATGTAAGVMADSGFRAQFDRERAYLAGLQVTVVEISNALERHLFEAYCALELGTGLATMAAGTRSTRTSGVPTSASSGGCRRSARSRRGIGTPRLKR